MAHEAILIMKVGFHGDEDLRTILVNKQLEHETLGYTFWGYNGTLCHPARVVQPVAKQAEGHGSKVRVLFVVTKSPFVSHPTQASQLSEDRQHWEDLPAEATVTASKFALKITNLREHCTDLTLNDYRVTIGPSKGKHVGEYLKYRVDKAVADYAPDDTIRGGPKVTVSYQAELVAPYAVFLR